MLKSKRYINIFEFGIRDNSPVAESCCMLCFKLTDQCLNLLSGI